ncbi:unnamed protein product [Ceutorhynchus assimilis]|uniref:Uncharacterized protein n=1 Tax=Ceutorhynchus assimilis TaxID=467358 RepID=A0A9N9MGU5_9CUCU|nr:unnamed protein product [Ceutorhynchus assimilis]
MPTQKIFTNQQVFGSPKNVWKPNPQAAQNFPKPVPMSGISNLQKPVPMSGISHGTNRFNNQNFQLHNVENAPYYLIPNPHYAENYNNYYDYQGYGDGSNDNNYSMQNDQVDSQDFYNDPSNGQTETNEPENYDQTPIEQNFQEAEPPAEMP